MSIQTLIRWLFPIGFQLPRNVPNNILNAVGYYRLRTWLAAYGKTLPDMHLYRPLYSPWEGETEFCRLYQDVKPHTLVRADRCYVLWKTLEQAKRLPGDIMECGVFRGGTALLAAKTLNGCMGKRTLHLFDTFEGMPQTIMDIDRFRAKDFNTTSLERVSRLLADYPFVRIHAGFIPKTFTDLKISEVAWAHVDVDIYQSVRDCITYIYPRLLPAGIIIFDDYGLPSCAGVRCAVDEAFAELPEKPLCLPTGQCLVIKLPS